MAKIREPSWPNPRPYLPPMEDPSNPRLKPAPTYADKTIAEAGTPITGFRPTIGEPGESEFSWGKGLMPPNARGHEPTAVEQMAAIRRTNPADPNAEANYKDWIRE